MEECYLSAFFGKKIKTHVSAYYIYKSDTLLVLRRDGSEGYLDGKNGEPRHASQAAAAESKPADVPSDSIPEETE